MLVLYLFFKICVLNQFVTIVNSQEEPWSSYEYSHTDIPRKQALIHPISLTKTTLVTLVTSIMLLILYVYSEIVAHVRSNLYYLICS